MDTKWRKAFRTAGGIKEFIVPLIFAAWLIYQFVASYSLKQNDFDSLGSDGYARIIAGAGLAFIVMYLIQKVVEIAHLAKSDSLTNSIKEDVPTADKTAKKSEKISPIIFLKTHYKISMLIMCIIYVFLISKIGFIIASALYLLASMLLFSDEKRKIWLIVLLSAVFSVGIFYMFRYGFTILLP